MLAMLGPVQEASSGQTAWAAAIPVTPKGAFCVKVTFWRFYEGKELSAGEKGARMSDLQRPTSVSYVIHVPVSVHGQ